jgi:benzoylformate decarboxylase
MAIRILLQRGGHSPACILSTEVVWFQPSVRSPINWPLTTPLLFSALPVFLHYAHVPGDCIKPGARLFQITNSPSDAAAALAGTSILGNTRFAAEYIHARVERVDSTLIPPRKPAEPDAGYPMSPAYLFSVLNRVIPKNSVIAEEYPSAKGDLDTHLLLDGPCSFYSVRSGILGFGLPAAVGLQLARPDRCVVALIGDGSAQYSIQALRSAAQYKASVVFIILCNGDYSALKAFQTFTSVGPNVPSVDIPGIDMVKLAAGYDLQSEEVDRPEDLEPALARAFASNTPCLLSVKVRKGGERCMGINLSVNPPNYG